MAVSNIIHMYESFMRNRISYGCKLVYGGNCKTYFLSYVNSNVYVQNL